MKPTPSATLLFHLSDEPRASFSAPSDKRPAFYWFNDSYHSHILGDKPAYQYMYFFIVKPDSGVGLFARHGKGDFVSLWADYTEYLRLRSHNEEKGVKHYLEPAIVMSFSEMVPSLIGEFSEDYTLTVTDPEHGNKTSFDLGENGQFRKFVDIPELVALCPDIVSCVPVVHPDSKQLKNPSMFWSPDTEHQGKMWM